MKDHKEHIKNIFEEINDNLTPEGVRTDLIEDDFQHYRQLSQVEEDPNIRKELSKRALELDTARKVGEWINKNYKP